MQSGFLCGGARSNGIDPCERGEVINLLRFFFLLHWLLLDWFILRKISLGLGGLIAPILIILQSELGGMEGEQLALNVLH